MAYLEHPNDYADNETRERLYNVFGLPVRCTLPEGWRGWLILHYRKRGLNIKQTHEHAKAELGFLADRLKAEEQERFYAGLLKHRVTDRACRVANENTPNLIFHRTRLIGNLIGPSSEHGWWNTWQPPRYGALLVNPMAIFASKQARIHGPRTVPDVRDLFRKRRPSSRSL